MGITFEQGLAKVRELCKYFETNKQTFMAPGIKEAHVRQSLIDPLFEALGWDVRNSDSTAPQYREVIPEDSLDVEGSQKSPDYTFRVGTTPKFYVEAKKCGVNIKTDPAPAYQLRRYGWSAKLPLSILTDFEEMAVYDCTKRPKETEKASARRILYFNYTEYPDRWREIWDIFSREAIWGGSFDNYVGSGTRAGTSEVDTEFLKEIEAWREKLARNIALRNPDIDIDDLNASVQRTIDRIIFLRMAEDRRIEPDRQLLGLCDQPDIYKRFIGQLCKKADDKYNSGLFHFKKEEGVTEAPDKITPKLIIDDRVFKPIIQSLYFEHGSPYQFNVLPVEILGTVYERFLGKVIRLTAGHQAKIEEKPEVRKAGGVYYTPAYIVEYIVKNTVGRKVESRSPAQLAGSGKHSAFRVLDMACGSGSFLLGAYQFLLNHCLSWYLENKPTKHPRAVMKHPRTGEWRLTIEEKKRILTTHIYGVDIDPQAVEVAKLSLMLKALEGEDDQSLSAQLQLFHERALPNLAGNIKCGNSLIGPDYFLQDLAVDPEEVRKINPLDWEKVFPDAISVGGFDCIIGNPPYVIITDEIMPPSAAAHLREHRVAHYKTDLYHLFLVDGTLRLREGGVLGYITPCTWLTLPNGRMLREWIINHSRILKLVTFAHKVFASADVYTSIIFLERSAVKDDYGVEVMSFGSAFSPPHLEHHPTTRINIEEWRGSDGVAFDFRGSPKARALVSRIRELYPRLSDVARVSLGAQAYNSSKHTKEEIKNRVFHADRRLSAEYLPELAGSDVGRYSYEQKKGKWIKYGPWLHDYRTMDWISGPRVLVREILGEAPYRLLACYIEETFCNYKTILNVSPKHDTGVSMKYIAAVLNSRLVGAIFPLVAKKPILGSFPRISVQDLKDIPVALPDMDDNETRKLHDTICDHVDRITRLATRSIGRDMDPNSLMEYEEINKAIDHAVYSVYRLNSVEIAWVEANGQ